MLKSSPPMSTLGLLAIAEGLNSAPLTTVLPLYVIRIGTDLLNESTTSPITRPLTNGSVDMAAMIVYRWEDCEVGSLFSRYYSQMSFQWPCERKMNA